MGDNLEFRTGRKLPLVGDLLERGELGVRDIELIAVRFLQVNCGDDFFLGKRRKLQTAESPMTLIETLNRGRQRLRVGIQRREIGIGKLDRLAIRVQLPEELTSDAVLEDRLSIRPLEKERDRPDPEAVAVCSGD